MELPLGVGKIYTHYEFVKATDHIVPNSKLQVDGTITHESVKDEPTIESYLKEKFELKNVVDGVRHSNLKEFVTGAYLNGNDVMALVLTYQDYSHFIGSAHLFNHLHAFSMSIVRLQDEFQNIDFSFSNFKTLDKPIIPIAEKPIESQGENILYKSIKGCHVSGIYNRTICEDMVTVEDNLVKFFNIFGKLIIVGLWEQSPGIEDYLYQICHRPKAISITVNGLSDGYCEGENLIAALKSSEKGRELFLTKVGSERLQGKIVARFARSESLSDGWEIIQAKKIEEVK